ncbi:TPA: helix-turn-helix domain-containing protein [Vibrio cholerae]|nr:helix-turn-helix domain-containing protein [Vibrio cholerae]HDV5492288.1 helix-turn-helix domain-containing protein [Vibrio cholerae]
MQHNTPYLPHQSIQLQSRLIKLYQNVGLFVPNLTFNFCVESEETDTHYFNVWLSSNVDGELMIGECNTYEKAALIAQQWLDNVSDDDLLHIVKNALSKGYTSGFSEFVEGVTDAQKLTNNELLVLECLRPQLDFEEGSESGQYPWSNTDISDKTGIHRSNLHRVLKSLVSKGLIVEETVKRDVWASLKKCGHVQKDVLVYYPVATRDEDLVVMVNWEHWQEHRQKEAMQKWRAMLSS